LGGAYIEVIHDDLVALLWPGTEPVGRDEQRSRELIDSAVHRPFHSAFEQDAYPSILENAAALFHSLIANHPFLNGNKRTAVIAFDHFLAANGYFLFLGNSAMYTLAQNTASYKQRGMSQEDILRQIRETTQNRIVSLATLRSSAKSDASVKKIQESAATVMRMLRRNPLNEILK
jgi:death-on-curing family protein